ncbi:MAG: M50 family metallopeptidase [Elusimicrobium sp.]|jgi:regulator of sigma E protease|nr:M50 family metallopeptidase [Elusimicrobium sp.]
MLVSKILSFLLTAVAVLVVLSPIILIHEFGHFIMCRLTGIRVLEFSFGLGKVLWSKKRGRTKYSVRAVPFGGFVNPAGEMFVDNKDGKHAPKSHEFASKKWWQKFLMVISGATMNYVLAFAIFTGLALAAGRLAESDLSKIPPAVDTVISGMSADKAGVRQGDRIVRINGVQINNWQNVLDEVKRINGDFTLSYQRADEIMNIPVKYSDFTAAGSLLGITAKPVYKKVTVFSAISAGAYQCWYWTKFSLLSIYKSLAAKKAPDLAGPVGIVNIIHKAVSTGVMDFIWLIGLLSLAVGMFNLFPIPVLDGGYALMFLWEGVSGKAPTEKFVKKCLDAGLVLLILLVFYATVGDVKRIIKKPAAQPAAAEQAPEKK